MGRVGCDIWEKWVRWAKTRKNGLKGERLRDRLFNLVERGGGDRVGGRAFEVREKDLSRLLSRYLFFCAHRTHFSHMSHPTFPTSHLLFLFFKFLFFAHPLLSRLGVTAPQLLEPYADAVRAVKLPFQPPPIQSHPDSKPP